MPSPLCRCRVLYIGSAVPTVTKDGLQGIQEPLKERYPIDQNYDTRGIDSWLSIWSNGILLEYIDNQRKSEAAFFPIDSLHYCAAVRYVNVTGYEIGGGGERSFLPLDSPFANLPDSEHPPIFAAILRKTKGVRVLECHSFICANEKAANALVRSCFHAYADNVYVKLDEHALPGNKPVKAIKDKEESSRSSSPKSDANENGYSPGADDSQSEKGEVLRWSEVKTGKKDWQSRQQSGDYETASISSSLARRYKKKEKISSVAGKPQDEFEGALVPIGYGNWRQQRRANSELNLASATMTRGRYPAPGQPPFMPGRPMPLMINPGGPAPMMGPGSPRMMGPGGPPLMMGPGGPVPMMGPPGPMPMMGPPGPMPMMGPAGPMPMMGPRGPMPMMGPEPPMMGPPPPHMLGPGGPPFPMMGPGKPVMMEPNDPMEGPVDPMQMQQSMRMRHMPPKDGARPPPEEMMGPVMYRDIPPDVMQSQPAFGPEGPYPRPMMMPGFGPGHPMGMHPMPPGGPIIMEPEGPYAPGGSPSMYRPTGQFHVSEPGDPGYATFPRGSGGPHRRSFEEPVYMHGGMPHPQRMVPPGSSYQPNSFPADQYDAYYDYYGSKPRSAKQSKSGKKGGANSSTLSSKRNKDEDLEYEAGPSTSKKDTFYWDSNVYESGIFRKNQYLNERAFSTSIQRENFGAENGETTDRPPTPPADYDVPYQIRREERLQQNMQDLNLSDAQRYREKAPNAIY